MLDLTKKNLCLSFWNPESVLEHPGDQIYLRSGRLRYLLKIIYSFGNSITGLYLFKPVAFVVIALLYEHFVCAVMLLSR